jgi:hypothetical protein
MEPHPAITGPKRRTDTVIERKGMTPAGFGARALDDRNLHWHLNNGRKARFTTLDRSRKSLGRFMRQNEGVAA